MGVRCKGNVKYKEITSVTRTKYRLEIQKGRLYLNTVKSYVKGKV